MRFLLFLLIVLLASCNKPAVPKIGVIPKGASHQFWLTVQAGAIEAGREFGYEIEWNAPALEIDASRQIDIMQSMVTRQLAGVAIAPVDKQALAAVIEKATKQGVPVAVYDSDVDTRNRLTYIATDNKEAGRMAARRMGEVLNGKGKVLVVGFMPGSASTMEREAGFLEEAKAKFPNLEVLEVQFGMANRSKAMAVTENAITAHKDLAGVFADNESSLAGAVQALKPRGLKQIRLVGIDASEQLIADLREDWIDSLIVQDPFRMGYLSVKAIADKRKGNAVTDRTDLAAKLILKADLANPAIQDLLFPKLEKWLKGASPQH
ncbi:MAG: substrate-binding domain-containing protein [Acidobacteria bacterium]|nr:substrate-binding domain-containing protein [Acidobacteriota bacterium]